MSRATAETDSVTASEGRGSVALAPVRGGVGETALAELRREKSVPKPANTQK